MLFYLHKVSSRIEQLIRFLNYQYSGISCSELDQPVRRLFTPVYKQRHCITFGVNNKAMKTSKCTHKTCDHCKNLSNPPNYSEDEYDYLAKGRFNCR